MPTYWRLGRRSAARRLDRGRAATGQIASGGERAGSAKQVRTHLIETARPLMEALVEEATDIKVVSLHHDISTATGEEIVLFTLAMAPSFRELKKKISASPPRSLANEVLAFRPTRALPDCMEKARAAEELDLFRWVSNDRTCVRTYHWYDAKRHVGRLIEQQPPSGAGWL